MERYWSCSKNHFVRQLLIERQALTKASLDAVVIRSLKQVPLTAVKNLLVSNRAYIRSVLMQDDDDE